MDVPVFQKVKSMKCAVKYLGVGLSAISLLAALPANALPFAIGDTVTVTENNITPTLFVSIYNTDIGGPYTVYAGINNLTVSGNGNTVAAQGFCIDPFHWSFSGPGPGYTVVALQDAPKSPGGGMGALEAAQISMLWAQHFNGAVSDLTGLNAAALQVSIWDIVGQGGLGSTGIDGLTITGSSDILNLATAWVSGVANPSGGPSADILGLTHTRDGQDYVIANVPDGGTTLMLLGFALAGLAVANIQFRPKPLA